MGIERKNPKLNWIGSFGLIILAGTFYRLGGVSKRLMQIKVSDLIEKAGGRLYTTQNGGFKKVFPSEGVRTPQDNAEAYKAKYEMRIIRRMGLKIPKWH